MIKPKKINNTKNAFYQRLDEMINLRHELCVLAEKINWDYIEKELSEYYSEVGRHAKSIRLMVSLLLLKQICNVSDETVVSKWIENPYWQYFSGEEYFQWKFPCDPTELVKFRNRIGEQGIEIIFKESIRIHGKQAQETELVADTTVQEKNITYPTDTKLHLKIIGWALRMRNKYGLVLRQSYTRTIKTLRWNTRYLRTPHRAKEGRKAVSKIKTIAGRLLREVKRLLSPELLEQFAEQISIMERVLSQKKNDKNKIYSIHAPETACIAKGKEHKKYEFGSKVSILRTSRNGIIVGARSFTGNPYDGDTLAPALEQAERLREIQVERVLVDEGYRGRNRIGESEIIRAHRPVKGYSKYRHRKWFRRRASVEASISHLKIDYGMNRNYLKGSVGDSINCMLAAAAFNLKMFLNRIISLCLFAFGRFLGLETIVLE